MDAALQAKKEDVTKLIGRDGVAGAWEIKISMVSSYRNIRIKTILIAGTSVIDNQQRSSFRERSTTIERVA